MPAPIAGRMPPASGSSAERTRLNAPTKTSAVAAATTPAAWNTLPSVFSSGPSTSPMIAATRLMPPRKSANPRAIPSPSPVKGSSNSSPSRVLDRLSASMPAPKSSICRRSTALSDPPSLAMSSAAPGRLRKNGRRSAPARPKRAMAAAVRCAGSVMSCSREPMSLI